MTTTLTHWLIQHHHTIKHILFVFAHPDDEILCSGGLLQWVSAHGFIPHVLIVTHGEKGNHRMKKNQEQTARIRKDEFLRVMDMLHVPHKTMWAYPDGDLTGNKDAVTKDIQNFCARIPIDCIITHDFLHTKEHRDHRTLAECCRSIASTSGIPVFFTTPLLGDDAVQMCTGCYTVRLSKPMMAKKVDLLKLYESQFSVEHLTHIGIRHLFFPNEKYRKGE